MAAPRVNFPHPSRPGVDLTPGGAAFRVFAGHADAVWLCLFGTVEAPGVEQRVAMHDLGGGHWGVVVPGAAAGTLYGYRVAGEWNPGAGHRHNPAKLLIDPYARALDGGVTWRPEVFGHVVDVDFTGDANIRDDRDSAPFVPRCIVVDDTFDWGDDDARPRTAMADSVIYELHVKGFSERNQHVPEDLRGTYAGLAHPASIAHLTSLGVTAVELLPVHAFVDEPHLVKLGLRNYWGYNTVAFLAPHAGYSSSARHGDAHDAVDEFKQMVKDLHAAGIEVILDVVYNHTAEQGGHEGATLSLRGLDNHSYYRLDGEGRDVDVTGCGNSVDVRHPEAMRLVLDSLRHWAREYHVDGFRFDLAVTLGRSPADDFDPNAALLMAIRTDPQLCHLKLIAEPWDVGPDGWRTGRFPSPFGEWNDRFRNTVRDFWLADVAALTHAGSVGSASDLATRLAGSRDLFSSGRRRPQASINYVTAHDGFTLADLTAYDTKHNEANGEENRDGTNDNRSWNHGVEGWPAGGRDHTDERDGVDALRDRRMRSMRNVLGTLLLSAGVPMLTAGDEFARSQGGNNNAYCQDSPIGWMDWNLDDDQRDLLTTTAHLIALRRRFSVLRHTTFFPGTTTAGGEEADLRWFGADGTTMSPEAWNDPATRTVQALFDGSREHEESLLLVVHGGLAAVDVTLPDVGERRWQMVWNSASPTPPDAAVSAGSRGAPEHVTGVSLRAYALL